MKRYVNFTFSIFIIITMALTPLGCTNKTPDNKVVIFSAAEEQRLAYILGRLQERFPDYEIVMEFVPTGTIASRIAAEGADILCDIVHEFDYGFAATSEPHFADLSSWYDFNRFTDDAVLPSKKMIPTLRGGACIAINEDLLATRGLPIPTSYQDLLDPIYRGLISMPSPVSSGTGFTFLYSLVRAWGEEAAFQYFDALSENLLHFTTSGMGPINDLIAGEVAIGFAFLSQAVMEVNNGLNVSLHFFEEGSPHAIYGMAIIEGSQGNQAVKDVFDYFYETLIEDSNALFSPEKTFRDIDFVMDNYPVNIPYSDMTGNSPEERDRLLAKWEH